MTRYYSTEEMLERIAELEAELLAAQEREKALREAAQGLDEREDSEGDWEVVSASALADLRELLAGSPSEKPGSEEEA